MYYDYEHRKKPEIKKDQDKKQSPNTMKPGPPPLRRRFQLQQKLGNHEVQRLMKQQEIMAKLYTSQPNDTYEQEADKVAEKVISMGNEGNDGETVGNTTYVTKLRKKTDSTGGTEISSHNEAGINSLKGKGQPMGKGLRDYFEPRFGVDLGNVRLHTGSNADKLARAIRAQAFTYGNNVVFGKNEYNPGTTGGKKLIAHELTHVLRQTGGNQQAGNVQKEEVVQRQEDDDETSASYSLQIIKILTDPSNYSPDHGCQRAWDILVTLDDELFVQVINEIKNGPYLGLLTYKIPVPLAEREQIMALMGTPGDQAVYDFMQVLKEEACRRLDRNRLDLDQMEERYRENLRVKDTSYGRYVRNSDSTGTMFALYNAILLDSQLQRTQTILSSRLNYINLEIYTCEKNVGADALLEENTIYERAAQSYRDWLAQRALIEAVLTQNTHKRMVLRDVFPAINVLTEVDRNEMNGVTPPGIERTAEMIFDGFERARRFQDKMREELLKDAIPVYKLDILVDSVKDILRSEGRWEEPYSTYIDNWLAGQETKETVMNIAGTAIEIGLSVAAVFTSGL